MATNMALILFLMVERMSQFKAKSKSAHSSLMLILMKLRFLWELDHALGSLCAQLKKFNMSTVAEDKGDKSHVQTMENMGTLHHCHPLALCDRLTSWMKLQFLA